MRCKHRIFSLLSTMSVTDAYGIFYGVSRTHDYVWWPCPFIYALSNRKRPKTKKVYDKGVVALMKHTQKMIDNATRGHI